MSRGLSVHYYKAMRGFNETCIMVRSPAVEIISALKATEYSAPNIRYVLYGLLGCGKSMTLAHVIHYCGRQGWFVAHEPWAAFHNRYYRDHQPSTFKPGRIDQPLDSADWLSYFRKMNEPLLTKSKDVPVTVGRYVWSKRETSEVGTPLVEMIDFALGRVKYASDVMGAILKELRLQASAGHLRTLVAVDGINAFSANTTIKREEDHSKRHVSMDLTMTQHWLSMLGDDWTGGAAVCTVDSCAAYPVDKSHYMPLELLGSDAFQLLDPFVPIAVPVYSDRESFSCIEYYRDRRWIQCAQGGTEDGRKELMSLSCNNPLELHRICVNW
jgi:small subunit ribosomal protein S29